MIVWQDIKARLGCKYHKTTSDNDWFLAGPNPNLEEDIKAKK